MMLGYTAAHTESLAMAVIVSKGINQLSIALNEETEDHILAATTWALGQIGRHMPEHAKAVAVANVLPKLLQLHMRTDMPEDLQTKALEPLLHEASPNILKHVVAQFSKALPHDPKARRLFVTSGGLKKIQEIKAEEGSPLAEYINRINSCFPEELVKYYSPGYADELLERAENHGNKP